MKKLLILSYYFPPMGMGGTQRIASFVKYLPSLGWQPTVITVKHVAYHAYDEAALQALAHARIIRTGSLDPLRLAAKWRPHDQSGATLSGKKNHFRKALNFFFMPDSKILWNPFAARRAQAILRHETFDAILSTGPPHSTHLIARALSQKFGMPWLADFRDTWAGGDFQAKSTRLHTAIDRRLQKRVLRSADAVVAVSQGLARNLAQSVPAAKNKISVITNGYEPDDFQAEAGAETACLRVAHIGTTGNFVQPAIALRAFRLFVEDAALSPNEARLLFVGADLDGGLKKTIAESGISEFIEVTGYLPHCQAIAELQKADVLLFLASGAPSAGFVPGKTFEYLAARKPVLAMCEQIEGLHLLQKTGLVRHALPDDLPGAVNAFKAFFVEKQTGKPLAPSDFDIRRYTRKSLAKKLAARLDAIVAARS